MTLIEVHGISELTYCALDPQFLVNLHGKTVNTLIQKGMKNFTVVMLTVFQGNNC